MRRPFVGCVRVAKILATVLLGGALSVLGSVSTAEEVTGMPEEVARGRALYHGKGACAMCHGLEGDPIRRPPMNEHTAAIVSNLDPPPADLRAPDPERFLSDQQRRKAIRKGHPGTGMLPDPFLSDQEIADILAYLNRLRNEPAPKTR